MKIGNLDIYGVIYKITNKINGKVYIGQTIDGFKIRYDGGKWWVQTHNKHLKSSVLKYGFENFEVIEVLDVAFSKSELDIKEILYIERCRCTDSNFGYNKKSGGANGRHSRESKLKMSISHKGFKLSEETKRKMSKIRKGKNTGSKNPMYGKNPLTLMSKEAYNELIKKKSDNMKGNKNPMYGKCGEANPFYGKKHSDETKRILSQKAKERLSKNNPLKGRKNDKAAGGNNPNSKNKIEVYDDCLVKLNTFDSLKECADWMVEIGLSNTFGGARWTINNVTKKDGIYKEHIFKKIKKNH